MFVQRQALAADLVERIHRSAVSDAKHHALLVGPRGIGKTHLVSLVYHRIQALPRIQDSLLTAWLHEEEWGIDSFLDLLLRILRALYEEYRDGTLAEHVEALYAIESPHEAQVQAALLLRDYAAGRTLLVIVENLDEVFKGLGDAGQKQFRAYMQEYPFITLLATSQSLFSGVSDRGLPFFGFFRPHHLKAFSLDDAVELLANIAEHEDKEDLAAFIRTPDGRARIRAVHHLAGGNPRVYVILSQFLTRESLDALVEPFMQMLDDLTPYYQARMSWLSAQQRKIVEVLIDNRAPLAVKQIASRCFITPATTSSQLKLLRESGYVESRKVGRESYYELREPLMRFSLEVKKHRADPIRLFIDFLRIWYTRSELQTQLDLLRPDAALERTYILYVLTETSEDSEDPRVAACLRDYEAHFQYMELNDALQVTDELIEIRGASIDWLLKANCLIQMHRFGDALAVSVEYLEAFPKDPALSASQVIALAALDRTEDARGKVDVMIDENPEDPGVWFVAGMFHRVDDNTNGALHAFQKTCDLLPSHSFALAYLALTQSDSGLYEDSLVSLDRYDRSYSPDTDDTTKTTALRARAFALVGTGRYAEGLDILNTPLFASSQENSILGRRAVAALMTSNLESGWDVLENIFPNETPRSLGLAVLVATVGDWADALSILRDSMSGDVSDDLPLTSELPGWSATAAALVVPLLSKAPLHEVTARVRDVFELCDEWHGLAGLSTVVLASLNQTSGVSAERREAWRDAWIDAAAGYDAFAPTLRMLDIAITYQRSNDPRALLELPVEERAILEQVLELSTLSET